MATLLDDPDGTATPYDDAIRKLDTPAPATVDAPGSKTPYDAALRSMDAAQQQPLRSAVVQADQTTPDRAAQVKQFSDQFGLAPDLVDRNFDAMQQRAKYVNTPFAQMLKDTPHTATFLSEPTNAAIAADDHPALGALEYLFTLPYHALAQSYYANQVSAINAQRFFGPLTADDQKKLDDARAYTSEYDRLMSGNSWFRSALTPSMKFAAGLVQPAALPATIGAGVGAAGGFVAAGPAGVLPGAYFGAGIGSTAGIAQSAFLQTAGAALERNSTRVDAFGQPLQSDVSKMAALGEGVLAAALMVGGGKVVGTVVDAAAGKVAGLFTQQAISAALRQPSVLSALGELAKRTALGATEVGLFSAGQEAATILSTAIVQANQPSGSSTPEAQPPQLTSAEAAERIATAGLHGAASSVLTMAALGGVGLVADVGAVKRAEGNKAFFTALADGVAQSKTGERMPAALEQFVADVTKDGPVEHVYAPLEFWNTYWQDKGVDPREMANTVTGNPDAYDIATQQGGDLEIPTARYATKLAATEHNAAFADELRIGPDGMSAHDARDLADAVKNAPAPEPAAVSPLRQALLDKFAAAHVPASTATEYANLAEAVFTEPARRAGFDSSYTPEGLTVSRPDLEVIPRAGNGAASAEGAVSAPDGAQGALPADFGPGAYAGPERRTAAGEAPNGAERRATPATDQPIGLQPGFSRSDVVASMGAMRAENPQADALGRALQARAAAFDSTRKDAQTALEHGDAEHPESVSTAESARAGGRADEAGGVPDHGVSASYPREVERTAASGQTRVERETPAQRETRRLEHYADVFSSYLESARQVDPAVDPAALRAEFQFRVEALEERERGYDETGADPRNLLRDVSRNGGLAETAQGYAGELARLKEGTKFGTLNGIRNVLRGKQTLDERGQPKTGLGLDVMLQRLHQDEGKYDWITSESMLLDAIDEAARFEAPEDVFPGTDELRKAVEMDPASDWWSKAWRPTTDLLADGNELEATGDVDTSFNVDEFNQSLFDDLDVTPPDPRVDTLATGEQQPRLPGDVGDVRDAEKPTPEFDAPFSLTPPEEKAGAPKKTEPAMSPDYAAAIEAQRVAGAAFREATRKYRAREIGDEEYLAARKADQEATATFEAAYDREAQRGSRRTLFQSAQELTTEGVQAFADDLQARIGKDLRQLNFRLESSGDLKLGLLAIDRGAQRAGLGSKVMRELTRFADAHGKRIVLSPADKADFGGVWGTTSRGRLVDFYKRFGFVENKGRNRDFAIGDAMYREPTARPLATGTPQFKAWFGRSKVVDESGAPAVVYHGTGNAASILDRGFHPDFVGKGNDAMGAGYYFTNKETTARGYTSRRIDPETEKLGGEAAPGVLAVYLSIKNPIEINAGEALDDQFPRLTKGQARTLIEQAPGVNDPEGGPLENWGDVAHEGRARVLAKAVDAYTDGAPQMLANDFYNGAAHDFLSNYQALTGHDGVITSFDTGEKHYVAWFPEQIKSVDNAGTFDPTSPNILKQEKRGAIRFGPGKQVDIALLERADLSTFIHELGHLGVHVMADLVDKLGALDPETLNEPQRRLMGDFGALLEHVGADSFESMTEAQHEQLARSFEAYVMEGKAPSVALQSTFSRMRAWFVGIYRSLKNLNVQLTPEVRRVFDRMLASDQAIADAEARRGVSAMFATPEEAGMDPAEFALYRQTVQDAHDKAVAALDKKLLGEVQREQTRDWKEKRDAMRGQVEADVEARPEYRALAAITKGTQPDGSPLVEGMETEPMKLSRRAIVERFGADRVKRLPRGVVAAGEGIDPNTVAELFGYSSGDALLTAIEQAPKADDVIRAETNRRMLEEHGSLLLDGTLHDAARGAIENDTREDVLRAEMRALGRRKRDVAPFVNAERAKGRDALAEAKAERDYERRWFDAEHKLQIAIARGEKQVEIDRLQKEVSELKAKARGGAVTIRAGIPPEGVLRDAARARLATTPIGSIRPDVFWSAARQASREATEKAARQDFDGAITAKQQELINTHLYREAETALEDVADRVRFAQDLGTQASRARMFKAGPSYRDMVDSILERFEFANVPPGTAKRRTAIADWAAGLESQGLPVDLPPEVLNEALRTNYKYLTLEEFRGVTDGLKEIVHLAQIKNRMLKIADRKALDALTTELGDSIRANTTRKAPVVERDRRASSERSRTIEAFFGSHRKLSFILREMDGNVDGGPMVRSIMQPLNEAGAHEAEMNAAATRALGDLVERAYPAGEKRRLFDKIEVPAVGDSLSKMERLSIALNWGNEGNRDRVRRGEGWNDEQVQAVLDTLDARDLTFVQGVLDHINSYWPAIAAKQERVYGFAPEKVEATPIKAAAGEIPGGYYPLKYDDRLSARAAQNLDLEAGNLARQAAYAQATTQRGHTKARVEGVKLPVRRDFGVIFQHLGQVIHDLSHHETLIDIGRVLAHPTVQKAIYDTYGDQAYYEIKSNIRDIAFGDVPARAGFEQGLNHFRQGMSVAQLGWSMTTALLHLSGAVPKAIDGIGAKAFGAGMIRFARDAVSMESTAKWADENSAVMRTRGLTQQREINEIRNQVGVDSGKFSGIAADIVKHVTFGLADKQKMLDSYFYLLTRIQRAVDVPTFAGQYQKSIDAGRTHAEAVAEADQAVLNYGGGGQTKDLARIQRGGALAKIFTNFYSTFSTTYNMAANKTRATDFTSPAAIGRLAVDYLLLYTVPATFGYAIRNAAGGAVDDAKSIAGHLIQANLAYLADTMIGIRELAGFVEGYNDYHGPAGVGVVPALGNVIAQSEQEIRAMADGKPTDGLDAAFFKSLDEAGGIYFHYPAAQINRTLAGFVQLVEGKTKNPGVLFVGPPAAKK